MSDSDVTPMPLEAGEGHIDRHGRARIGRRRPAIVNIPPQWAIRILLAG
jgi:hypothetical protein